MNLQGTGIGLRTEHYSSIFNLKSQVPWLEIITENFLGLGGRPHKVLNELRSSHPVAFHGVGLSIGSLEPINTNYLSLLRELKNKFEPFLISDHLSWSNHFGENSYDLLPMPYTRENLQRLIERVDFVQSFLKCQIALENPSAYIEYRYNEMRESEFLRELTKQSGCAVLFDLNNLVVNHHNLGTNISDYISDLRSCDVPVFHLAGHTLTDAGVRIDTHDRHPDQETLALFRQATQLWPRALSLLEWDDQIPPLETLLHMRREVESIGRGAQSASESDNTFSAITLNTIRADQKSSSLIQTGSLNASRLPLQNYYSQFWQLVQGGVNSPSDGSGLQNFQCKNTLATQYETTLGAQYETAVGAQVYHRSYFVRLTQVLKKLHPTLAKICGDLFEDVAVAFIKQTQFTHTNIDLIGEGLAQFIRTHDFEFDLGADKKIFSEVAQFEGALNVVTLAADTDRLSLEKLSAFTELDWSQATFQLDSTAKLLDFEYSIEPVYEAVRNNTDPDVPEPFQHSTLVWRDDQFNARYAILTTETQLALKSFMSNSPTTLQSVVESTGLQPQKIVEIFIQFCEAIHRAEAY